MTVFLVGAGPGEAALLTRRAEEVLRAAEVVVFDRLVDQSVLALVPASAERIDVGKRPAETSSTDRQQAIEGTDRQQAIEGTDRQQAINRLLVERGRAHGTVVRLKGGDPFVFGRGGEEIEALRQAGIGWEVVPGVSSAFAAPASAGIPVTHRGLSTSVTVVTGHVGDPTAPGGVDWAALARAGGTIVVLMGMANRAEIAAALQAGGRPPDTPAAVVEWGATASERVCRTTLGALAEVDLGSPAVIVIGPVAALDLRPDGARGRPSVVVTRPRGRGDGVTAALRSSGIAVVEVPAVTFADPEDPGALRRAAGEVAGYDWVVFTSATAVHRFVPLLRDARAWGAARIGAVGPTTCSALGTYHLVADVVPARSDAGALAAALPGAHPGGRVLFPRAQGASEVLAGVLRGRGWEVDEVVAYATVPAPGPDVDTAAAVAAADAVLFASPSAVEAFLAMRDASERPLVVPPLAVCIGEVTAAAARRAGVHGVVASPSPAEADVVTTLVERLGAAGRVPGRSGSAPGRPR